jgi:hypothetical protein
LIDRRRICLGGPAAALAGGAAKAAPDTSIFASGPMAKNSLAAGFMAPPASLVLPDTPLISSEGRQRLSQLRGRTWLVSLWAEWCAPCLAEATDLAAIARAHSGPSFGVVFVLTNSLKKLDLADAQAVMAKRSAGDAPLLVEPHGGDVVAKALAIRALDARMRVVAKVDSAVNLPCNLLVDRHGRIRGRSFGAASISQMKLSHDGPMNPADKAKVLTEHTVWATPDGDAFAAALAAGLLERA